MIDPHFKPDFIGKELDISVTPMFKEVSNYYEKPDNRYLRFSSGYQGIGFMFKFFAVLSMLISCFYIFYKRGIIPFSELSINHW